MELECAVKTEVLPLKNKPRTLIAVAGVVQQIMKTLYAASFPDAETHRLGWNPDCPDSDILAVAWLLEYIGSDSEFDTLGVTRSNFYYQPKKPRCEDILRTEIEQLAGAYPTYGYRRITKLLVQKGYPVGCM